MNFYSCLRMPLDINTWRAVMDFLASVGNVSVGSSIFYLTKCFRSILYSILLLMLILFLLFTVYFYDKDLGLMAFLFLHVNSISIKGSFFILLSGYAEINPGPGPGYSNSFSFCHPNLNSIAAHNFIKMFLLQDCNAIHRLDIICLSETYLDNSYHTNDDRLAFPRYNLIRTENPNKIKSEEFASIIEKLCQ